MIDTHAHLEATFCDITRVAGLDAVILSAANLETSKNNLKLAEKYPQFYPAVGIHPTEIMTNYELQITNLTELLAKNKNIVAVGECGLEFLGEVDKDKQEIVFRKQIELAKKYHKPLIIHARKAVDETIQILSEYKDIFGVIHCYSGGKKRVKKVLALPGDWCFGFDGNLTYEVGLEEVVKEIPQDRILAETDSPLLTPEPFRGQENCPAYVKYVYQKIADIWGIKLEEAEKIIDANAKRLFGI
jgi:TatD DNase family protein